MTIWSIGLTLYLPWPAYSASLWLTGVAAIRSIRRRERAGWAILLRAAGGFPGDPHDPENDPDEARSRRKGTIKKAFKAPSYMLIPEARYPGVIRFLAQWYRRVTPSGTPLPEIFANPDEKRLL